MQKEYFTLSVKLKGDKVIRIRLPYQINKLYQYPLPGQLVCVLIKLVVIKEFRIEYKKSDQYDVQTMTSVSQ